LFYFQELIGINRLKSEVLTMQIATISNSDRYIQSK